MERLLLVEVEPSITAALREELAELPELQLQDAPSPLPDELAGDIRAVVIGPSAPDPVRTAQRAFGLVPDAPIVILARGDRYAEVCQELRFTPLVGGTTACIHADDHQLVRSTVHSRLLDAARRRALHTTMAALNSALAHALPQGLPVAGPAIDRLLEYAPIGLVVTGPGARVQAWSTRAAGFLGREGESAEGSILNEFREGERDRARALLARLDAHPASRDILQPWRPRAARHLEVTALSMGERGRDTALLILQDVTAVTELRDAMRRQQAELDDERHRRALAERADERRDAHLKATQALAVGRSEEEVLSRLLEAVASALGCEVGEVWLRDPEKHEWRRRQLWMAPEVHAQSLQSADGADPEFPEDDLGDLPGEPPPGRARAAMADGLQGALAFPVRDGLRVLGKVLLFSRRPQKLDAEMVTALTVLGAQVGQTLQRVAAEEAAHRALTEAEEAGRLREELLAVVSHDLKNPLNTMLVGATLLTEMLGEQAAFPEARRVLTSMISAVSTMRRLIGDLLDFAAVHAGRISLKVEEHEVASLVAESLEILQPQAAAKGVTLQAHVSPAGLRARCDRDRTLQVLSNLLANALRFTPEKGVVEVRVEGGDGSATFYVADSGPGLTEAEARCVFEPYWQAQRVRGAAGVGLGLSIAKGMVEAHGGRIWVHRTSPGATFAFMLPAAAPASPAVRGADARSVLSAAPRACGPA